MSSVSPLDSYLSSGGRPKEWFPEMPGLQRLSKSEISDDLQFIQSSLVPAGWVPEEEQSNVLAVNTVGQLVSQPAIKETNYDKNNKNNKRKSTTATATTTSSTTSSSNNKNEAKEADKSSQEIEVISKRARLQSKLAAERQKADSARETAVHLRMQVERARNEIHAFEDIILQTKKELEILKRDKEFLYERLMQLREEYSWGLDQADRIREEEEKSEFVLREKLGLVNNHVNELVERVTAYKQVEEALKSKDRELHGAYGEMISLVNQVETLTTLLSKEPTWDGDEPEDADKPLKTDDASTTAGAATSPTANAAASSSDSSSTSSTVPATVRPNVDATATSAPSASTTTTPASPGKQSVADASSNSAASLSGSSSASSSSAASSSSSSSSSSATSPPTSSSSLSSTVAASSAQTSTDSKDDIISELLPLPRSYTTKAVPYRVRSIVAYLIKLSKDLLDHTRCLKEAEDQIDSLHKQILDRDRAMKYMQEQIERLQLLHQETTNKSRTSEAFVLEYQTKCELLAGELLWASRQRDEQTVILNGYEEKLRVFEQLLNVADVRATTAETIIHEFIHELKTLRMGNQILQSSYNKLCEQFIQQTVEKFTITEEVMQKESQKAAVQTAQAAAAAAHGMNGISNHTTSSSSASSPAVTASNDATLAAAEAREQEVSRLHNIYRRTFEENRVLHARLQESLLQQQQLQLELAKASTKIGVKATTSDDFIVFSAPSPQSAVTVRPKLRAQPPGPDPATDPVAFFAWHQSRAAALTAPAVGVNQQVPSAASSQQLSQADAAHKIAVTKSEIVHTGEEMKDA